MTIFILAFLTHVLAASLVLKNKARAIGWDIPAHKVIAGQFLISALALAGALSLANVVLAPGFEITLTATVFAVIWLAAQTLLVARWARDDKRKFVAPWVSARVSRRTFFPVLFCNACAALVGLLAWHAWEVSVAARQPGTPGTIAGGGAIKAGAGDSSTSGREAEVLAAVHAWSAAWARKDVAGYLDAYAPGFRAPGGMSRAEWMAFRRGRIDKPGRISVRVVSPKATFTGPTRASVVFRQIYESDSFSDTTRKVLVMQRLDGKWKILEEESG
jgi:hypothetical protein